MKVRGFEIIDSLLYSPILDLPDSIESRANSKYATIGNAYKTMKFLPSVDWVFWVYKRSAKYCTPHSYIKRFLQPGKYKAENVILHLVISADF